MADTDVNTPDPIEEQARQHGWRPEAEFQGDKSKYVDAKTFMERAETFIPFLKKSKQETEQLLAVEREARQRLEADLEASRRSIKAIEKLNEEDRKAELEQLRGEVRAKLVEATKAGDAEGVATLTEQMVKLTATPAPVEEEDEEEETPPAPKLDPSFVEWHKKNTWYGTDLDRSDYAVFAARKLRREGYTSQGTVFLDKVSAEVDKYFRPSPRTSKVESSSLGGNGAGGAPNGKSYNDLPAEAKAECNSEAKKRVGPDKRYKTVADWNNKFAELYFSQTIRQ